MKKDTDIRKRIKSECPCESGIVDLLIDGNDNENLESEELEFRNHFCMPSRFILAVLGSLGFVNLYAMRTNLSIAIVAMTNLTSFNNLSKSCNYTDEKWLFLNHFMNFQVEKFPVVVLFQKQQFDWDEYTQGIILGSFFWGYLISQIPGGILSQKYSPKYIFSSGCLVTAVFTLLTPLAVNLGVTYLIIVRVIEGIGEGVTFPAMHSLLAKWTPPLERSKMAAFVYSGTSVGTMLSLPISGYLCQSSFLGGWPAVFYVFGTITIIWLFFWILLIYDSPSSHPFISQNEKLYITRMLRYSDDNIKSCIPWYSILSSGPVWAIIIAHMGSNWGFYTLLTELPTYMRRILSFNIEENGMLLSIPYINLWLVALISSWVADTLQSKEILNTTYTRKLFNCLGTFIPALALSGIVWAKCERLAVIVLLSVAVGFSGAAYSGHAANHIDIASNYAGILMGITNSMATLCGIFAPYFVGYMTNTKQTIENWKIIFYVSASIYAIGNIIYIIFGSGREQSWNRIDSY